MISGTGMININFHVFLGAVVKMESIQPALDPRKHELLEARFMGARVSIPFRVMCWVWQTVNGIFEE